MKPKIIIAFTLLLAAIGGFFIVDLLHNSQVQRPTITAAEAPADAAKYLKRCSQICAAPDGPDEQGGYPYHDKYMTNDECIKDCRQIQKQASDCVRAWSEVKGPKINSGDCMPADRFLLEDPADTFAKSKKEAEGAEHWYFYREQFVTAKYYRDGYGVKRDYVQAAKWCEISHEIFT